ncbi:MAG: hypothetical protein B9S32_16355 [Verrucomicrobia bacterium Tous-C9LFEB]|nr:MAG: hypothetical protein B9S32_16355 [Verrucomicrobia bacterium Tous-C9LFEB]
MKRWLERRFAPKLGAALIRLLGGTVRLHVHDPYHFQDKPNRGPVLFAFWHDGLFLLPYIQCQLFPHFRLAAMISRSKDGNLISNIIHEFGMYAARGSSSKRGSAALLALIHWLEEGIDAAITPDGPRGPRHKLQPGVLHLARQSGSAIIPLRIEYSHKIQLRSWDRFQIPWPFARCDLHFGAPITLASDANDDDLNRAARELTDAMGS